MKHAGHDPMSLAALIAGRDTRDAVRAVLSDSERVRKTLDRALPTKFTDPMDVWLMGPTRRAA